MLCLSFLFPEPEPFISISQLCRMRAGWTMPLITFIWILNPKLRLCLGCKALEWHIGCSSVQGWLDTTPMLELIASKSGSIAHQFVTHGNSLIVNRLVMLV
ncbi:hypothetical protein Droror1_Dr00007254 [Drosera rotundifolia]